MKVKMEQPNELLVDDLESLLRDIADFTTGSAKSEEIPNTLENYLLFVARTGNTVFPWQHVRTLFRVKMLSAINQFGGESSATEAFVLERFDLFRAAPFTIQRFTELITQPNRHYKKKEKFLRGLEKTVLVVSTVDPKPVHDDVKNGNENSNSSADADTDLGFSEGDELSSNRTFVLDQHEDLVTSAGSRGELDITPGSNDGDNVSSSNIAGTSAIAAASKALAESLQQVTGMDTTKMLQTDRSKMTELYRSYVDASDSVTTVSGAASSQIKLDASSTIIDVVSVPSDHNALRDANSEFVTHQQHRTNLVEISSSDGDFSMTKSVSMEVNTIIDENGNPPKVAAEVEDAIPVVEQSSSTPMEVDDNETSPSALYNIENAPIDSGIPTLQDISSTPPPAATICLEKDTMNSSTDDGIPVSSEIPVTEPLVVNDELVTEFIANTDSTNTNIDISCDNVIVSEGQEFTELKSQSSIGSGNVLDYENENRLVELNSSVIQTSATVHFNAEEQKISESPLSTATDPQYSHSPLQDDTGVSPTEEDLESIPVDGNDVSTDLAEKN